MFWIAGDKPTLTPADAGTGAMRVRQSSESSFASRLARMNRIAMCTILKTCRLRL
jgi:hypothetical protein